MTEKSPEQMQREAIQLALEAIETLALAERWTDAKTYLTELWPFITEGINVAQDPDDVDIFSGLALGYLKLGKRGQAQQFAKRALVMSPRDYLAHAIAPHSDRILVARHFMHYQQHRKASDLLDAIQHFTPAAEDETNFYHSLLRHYMSEKDRVRTLTPLDGRATLFNLVLWGETYVEKFLRFALPSLLAPGNIPALMSSGPIIFDIYTTQADRDRLAEAEPMVALAEIARIDYTIIPDALFSFEGTSATNAPDRLYVSGSQIVSAMKAKALGADLTYVVTEGLYSDHHFDIAKGYLRAGYKAVLMSSFRARDRGLIAFLDANGAIANNSIAIDAKHLLQFATQNINSKFSDLFIRGDGGTIGQDVVALYFKSATGFTNHTYQISPALISHELIPSDLEFDFHTSDTRFLSELASDQDPEKIYKVIKNPADELFVVDLESDADGTARIFGEFPVTVEQCVNSAIKWCNRETDFTYFEWAFQQRFNFECKPDAFPDSDYSESDTVTAFLSLFGEARQNQIQNIKYFRRDDALEH